MRRQIVGVDRPERVPVVAGALAALGTEQALVFSHETGGDELLPFGARSSPRCAERTSSASSSAPSTSASTKAAPARSGAGTPERNAGILRAVLGGSKRDARDIVVMNAAAALVVAGIAADFRDGVARGRGSARGGEGGDALDSLVRSLARRSVSVKRDQRED